ncbi:MAG TPA: hypothetical protein VI356_14395 [Myxococcales bacterium]
MHLLALQSAALLLATPAQDLQAALRHLDSVAAAWAPAPSRDLTRVAFLTTLFGTRQAASMAMEGSYPTQLTDEPGGVGGIAWVPPDAQWLIATVSREGHDRLLLIGEDGAAPVPIDPAAGDQRLGGFSRDGKRLFYAVVDGGKVSLRIFGFETRKSVEVAPPPPAAGVKPPRDSLPLDEALSGLVELGPPSPDARTLLARVKRSGGEAIVLLDLAAARGSVLVAPQGKGRFRDPRFSADGRTVYVLTDAGRATFGVDQVAVQGHERKTVFAPAQDVEAFAVTEDGHRLAVATLANGMNVFSLLDLPSLRPQPLAAPPAGSLAEGGLVWDRTGERLLFGWRQPDDTTDIWELRSGYGTPRRLTRSPRPGLPHDAIPRPALVHVGDRTGWLWRPAGAAKPRVAVLVQQDETRPVFDKRIAALNFAGLAVLSVSGSGAQKAALAWLASAPDLDAHGPVLLDPDDLPLQEAAKWSAVVKSGAALDPDHPDLKALVKSATRSGTGL